MAIAAVSLAYLAVTRSALIEASPSRLEELTQDGRARRILRRRLEREEEIVTTIDALRTVAGVLLTLCVYILLRDIPTLVRATAAAGIALLLLAALTLPGRAGGRAHAERILLSNLGLLCALEVAFRPLRLAAQALERAFFRLSGAKPQPPDEKLEEEIMEVVAEGEREGAIAPEDREIIETAIEFHDLDIGRLMTPRTEMIAIEDTRTIDQARALIIESAHSRIPVFHEDRDHIVGILHERDVLSCESRDRGPAALCDIMREAHFVPENMRIRQLLKELKDHTTHIVIVLDEYGGTAGIITFTDLVEEIVGEVRDEHEHEEPPEIRIVGPARAEVLGTLRLDELNETMDLRLPEEKSFDTIGGLVESVAGRVPAAGEEIVFANVRVVVLDADERSVQRLRLEVLKSEDGD